MCRPVRVSLEILKRVSVWDVQIACKSHRTWLYQQAYYSPCPSLKLYLPLSCMSEPTAVRVSSICRRSSPCWQVIDSGEGGMKMPPAGISGLWPCGTLLVLVCACRSAGVWPPSLTACRGTNRSNRGAVLGFSSGFRISAHFLCC